MADDRYDKVTHDGKIVDKYTDYNLHLAEERLGYELSIMQGSYNKGVAASAGTHDGGGTVDLKPWDWENKVRVLRELGFAAWRRPYRKGVWPEHIHAVLIGNTKLAPLAKQQVQAYRNGRDGLAGNGRDTFWRPAVIKDAAYKEPTMPASSRRVPADILDLDNWKLTPPVGRPDEVKQPLLASFNAKPYFWADGDGVRFRAHVGGATTSGSKYPRSELREMTNAGKKNAAWTNKVGHHEMNIEQAIIATPKVKPHVVAGQIHNGDDDVVMVRLEGKRLFVEGGGQDLGLLDANYQLGTRFRIRVAAGSGGIRVVYNDTKFVNVPKKIISGAYFKAGCYTQAYAGQKVVVNGAKLTVPEDTYGEVVIYKLTVKHK